MKKRAFGIAYVFLLVVATTMIWNTSALAQVDYKIKIECKPVEAALKLKYKHDKSEYENRIRIDHVDEIETRDNAKAVNKFIAHVLKKVRADVSLAEKKKASEKSGQYTPYYRALEDLVYKELPKAFDHKVGQKWVRFSAILTRDSFSLGPFHYLEVRRSSGKNTEVMGRVSVLYPDREAPSIDELAPLRKDASPDFVSESYYIVKNIDEKCLILDEEPKASVSASQKKTSDYESSLQEGFAAQEAELNKRVRELDARYGNVFRAF